LKKKRVSLFFFAGAEMGGDFFEKKSLKKLLAMALRLSCDFEQSLEGHRLGPTDAFIDLKKNSDACKVLGISGQRPPRLRKPCLLKQPRFNGTAANGCDLMPGGVDPQISKGHTAFKAAIPHLRVGRCKSQYTPKQHTL